MRKPHFSSADTVDRTVNEQGLPKRHRLDLGLALLAAVALPKAEFTQREISAWCGCTQQAIALIEREAIRKLRARLKKLGIISPAGIGRS